MNNCVATRTLITTLALLQLIAPLVHGHLGFDSSPPGIHVPGLEFVSPAAQDSEFKSVTSRFTSDGMVVAIVTGVSHHVSIVVEQRNLGYIPVSGTLRVPKHFSQKPGGSPPRRIAVRPAFHSPASPRAPPTVHTA